LSFLATIPIAIIGLQLSAIAAEMHGIQALRIPLLFVALAWYIQVPSPFTLYSHPVLFAAWIGAFLTFLNALPFWQLDGGHVVRTITSRRGHMIFSFITIAFLILIGWTIVALILLALFMLNPIHPGPLDDVSPLSTSRKLLVLGLVVMVVLCAPVL
jgi:membrane-associated protease RseP (regulator of RpoE activity)